MRVISSTKLFQPIRNMLNTSGVTTDISILTIFWILSIVIVNPLGDFPLNDDWSYGLAVKNLIDKGGFYPTPWTSMPLISQVLWGWLFCVPFGFSFTVLRFSTLLLGLIGTAGTYLLLRQIGLNRLLAVAGACVLAANPIYFSLSYTFMTDVPFTAFSVLALLFLILYLQKESNIYLIIGCCFTTIAILCRQLGLFLPITFTIAIVAKHGISRRSLVRAGFILIMGFGSKFLFESWLQSGAGLPVLYNATSESLFQVLGNPKLILSNLTLNMLFFVLYLGLFLLPFMLFIEFKSKSRVFSGILLGVFATGSTTVLLVLHKVLPQIDNVMIKSGIGPITLHDTYLLKLPNAEILPAYFWITVTAFAILGGSLLFVHIVTRVIYLYTNRLEIKNSPDSIIKIFTLSACLIYFLPIIFTNHPFDRWLLPLVPLLCAAMTTTTNRTTKRLITVTLASLIMIVMAIFSIAGTRDYLSWNRARWQALHDLTEKESVSPNEIDGGFEFNGWYLCNSNEPITAQKSIWGGNNTRYMITMGPVRGFEFYREYTYEKWLPPGQANIYVLRRAYMAK
jgi:4-amino-4-deoxy-L-arabinose transferase-like glycosyltransferase